jgi:hypothetical protein
MKNIWIVAIAVVVIVVVVIVVSVVIYKFNPTKDSKYYACSMEAKICPDGTAVGRTGPNCQFTPCPTATTTPEKTSVQNVNIKAGDTVASPLQINGEARGTWYFEASFPVQIYDANGILLGSVPAQAQSGWMTEDFVPFKATLTFAIPTTESGKLVLKKDNPSGLPQNDAQIEISVRFSK